MKKKFIYNFRDNPIIIKAIPYVLIFVILMSIVLFQFLIRPTNSLQLFNALWSAEEYKDVKKLILEGREQYFTEEDFKYLKSELENKSWGSNNAIIQYTVLSFRNGKEMVLIETTPGTQKLYIRDIVKVPDEVKKFIIEQRLDEIN